MWADVLVQDPETDVGRVFGGMLASCVECEACRTESNTYDPFHDLSLELSGCGTVAEALAAFTARERLCDANAYHCERCRRYFTVACCFGFIKDAVVAGLSACICVQEGRTAPCRGKVLDAVAL